MDGKTLLNMVFTRFRERKFNPFKHFFEKKREKNGIF